MPRGLEVGDAKVKVIGGDMPVYYARPSYARPSAVQHPPIILVCMEIFGLHEFISLVIMSSPVIQCPQ
jgi:carboxymethylenebutenolidase